MTAEHRTLWLFHATAMVRDYDAAFAALEQLIGIRVVYEIEAGQAGAGYRGGAVWVGDNSIELGEPIDAGSPVARFVHDHGGGIHSFCISVPDVAATVAHLEGQGVRHTPVFPPGFFFCDPRDTGGILLEAERAGGPAEGGNTRRAIARPPTRPEPPVLDVTSVAFVGAIVTEPVALAQRFAELLGTTVTFERPDAPVGSPVAGVSLIDSTLALYAMPGDDSASLWGRRYERPRAHVIGLGVPDLADAGRRLEAANVAFVRGDDDVLVIDPAATGDVALALVDRLLPGDPRGA
jgi:catechol 2,3-dioxygenase-like lactoylglutathione lyase family enzyme